MEIVRTGSGRFTPPKSRVVLIPRGDSAPFARELARREEKLADDDRLELEAVRGKLEEAGIALERDPSVANFRLFRDLLGRFARQATAAAYRIEKVWGKSGRWAEEAVAVVNREADLLYHLVMQGQRERVAIASRIAVIKGMIVQLTA